jgi:hypothetical protein
MFSRAIEIAAAGGRSAGVDFTPASKQRRAALGGQPFHCQAVARLREAYSLPRA